MAEKRDIERLSYTNRLTVMDSNTGRVLTKEARLQNISINGLAFLSEEPILRGLRYRFQMIVNGSPLTLIARVVHTKSDPFFCIGGAKIESMAFLDRIRMNRFLMGQSQKWQMRFLLRALAIAAILTLSIKMVAGIGFSNSMALYLGLSTLFFALFPV